MKTDKTKHSPAPWTVGESDGIQMIFDANGDVIADLGNVSEQAQADAEWMVYSMNAYSGVCDVW